jgi:hypothetical protein
MFQWFLDAANYWFGYSDNSSAGSYDPARECFVMIANDQANTANAAWRRRGPPRPQNWTTPGRGAKCAPTSPPRCADINAQLAQARELEAKLAEEYPTVRLLRASIAGEASARGERVRELGKQARECINADFDVDNLNTAPRASQRLIAAATLLRAMPAPLTPEARNLHREAQALIRAQRPASACRGARETTGARKALRCQFTRALRRGSPPTKARRRSGSRSLTRAGRPRTTTLATSSMPGGRATRSTSGDRLPPTAGWAL